MPLSTFLNGQNSTQLRGLLWLSLTDSGWPLAGTVTADSGGGGTSTWVAGGTVACRVDPLTNRPMSQLIGGAIDERSTHYITVPAGTTVNSADRFVVSGRGTFQVTSVHTRTDELATVFEVLAL